MKVLLVAHGAPPELEGGTERSVVRLGTALLEAGHEARVVCGSVVWKPEPERTDDLLAEPGRPALPVHRLHRTDTHFEHWHKARSADVRARFTSLLHEHRPDVVHVHHWLRLSRDLICAAARVGIPAVVSLHDSWTTCLLAFRVRSDREGVCEESMGPMPCIACAHLHFRPETPWVDWAEEAVWLSEHRADLERELDLARAWIVPSRSHGERIARLLGRDAADAPLVVVPPVVENPPERLPAPPPPGTDRPLELVCTAHLAQHKGVHVAVEALRRLGRPAGVVLHVLGSEVDPAYATYLHELAGDVDVRFHGAYRPSELAVHPALTGAHLFLATSLGHESYGLALDEALALGLPALLTEVGAFPERARGRGWARLVPPADADALAAAIAELRDSPERLAAMRDAVPPRERLVRTGAEVAGATCEVYERAVDAGAPDVPAEEWFETRVQRHAEQEWDRQLSEQGVRDARERGDA